jgi:D-arabinose 1-dehydrogenase-like Zn-dependent alcohol dehydrogenase
MPELSSAARPTPRLWSRRSGWSRRAGTAREFGATHLFNSTEQPNVVKTLRALTNGGADYSFECVGRGEIVSQAYGILHKGGELITRTYRIDEAPAAFRDLVAGAQCEGSHLVLRTPVTWDALGLVRNINMLDPRLFGIVIGKPF